MDKKTLYYFTLDYDKIKKNGFEGSKNIDKGVGGKGQSLIGTYFFERLEDLENYRPLLSSLEKRKGKKGEIVEASLDENSRILNGNEKYMEEFRKFRNEENPNSEVGTYNFQKEFTNYLKNKGYDAVRIQSSLLGNHNELIVLNENKLKLKNEKDFYGIEKKVMVSIGAIFLGMALSLNSINLTGNIILDGINSPSGIAGSLLFVLGIIGFIYFFKY